MNSNSTNISGQGAVGCQKYEGVKGCAEGVYFWLEMKIIRERP
jgi:hypothetical protein